MSELKELCENSSEGLVSYFARLTAHDLNNMINTISTASELLAMEGKELSPRGTKYLDIINQSTDRLKDLSSRLSSFGDRAKGDEESLDPLGLLDDYLSMETALSNRTVPLLDQAGKQDLRVRCDRKKLLNIFHWICGGPFPLKEVVLSTVTNKKGLFCEFSFIKETGGETENDADLFDPWHGGFSLYAAKRAAGAAHGEVTVQGENRSTVKITLRLPASE